MVRARVRVRSARTAGSCFGLGLGVMVRVRVRVRSARTAGALIIALPQSQS